MTENTYVVAKVEPCPLAAKGQASERSCCGWNQRCIGCRTDGTRAVLEQAQRVEPKVLYADLAGELGKRFDAWVPVDTEER